MPRVRYLTQSGLVLSHHPQGGWSLEEQNRVLHNHRAQSASYVLGRRKAAHATRTTPSKSLPRDEETRLTFDVRVHEGSEDDVSLGIHVLVDDAGRLVDLPDN